MPRKGYKFTDEQKKRLSESHKGKTPWNKGKRGLQSAWNKDMKGYTNTGTFKKGHSQSIEARKKMSLAKKGKPSPKKGIPLTQDTKLKFGTLNDFVKRNQKTKFTVFLGNFSGGKIKF